jgi:uncharacterized protein YndB with AHSA1/START domain
MTKRIELTVCRTIPATPDEVFDAWLDVEKGRLAQPGSEGAAPGHGGPWIGASRAIVNATVDGLFYHSVHHAGREWAHYGRFLRLDRGQCIEHTWVSEATRGIESIVTLTLDAQSKGTLVTLRHAQLPDDDMGRQHEEGWTFVLQALADRFAARPY